MENEYGISSRTEAEADSKPSNPPQNVEEEDEEEGGLC